MAVSNKNIRKPVTMPKEMLHVINYLADVDNRTASSYITKVLAKHLRALKGTAIMKQYEDFYAYEEGANL